MNYTYPFKRGLIGYDGYGLDLIVYVKYVIGNEPTNITYMSDDYVTLTFDNILPQEDLDILFTEFNNLYSKNSLSPIEVIQKRWADSDTAVIDLLHLMEDDLKVFYDASTWNSFTLIEKQILAYWNICTSEESLEVLTEDDRKSHRYYNLYKFVTPHIKERLTKDSIKTPPYEHDFKTELMTVLHKEVLPLISGRPTKVNYYVNKPHIGAYSDMIASIVYTFTDDIDSKMILVNNTMLMWCWNDGEIDNIHTKDIGKVYDPTNAYDRVLMFKEGEQRRSNIWSGIQDTTIGVIMMDRGISSASAQLLVKDAVMVLKPVMDTWIVGGDIYTQNVYDVIDSIDPVINDWLLIELAPSFPLIAWFKMEINI